MGEVVQLFGTPPAAEGSVEVQDFVSEHLLEFMSAVTTLDQSTTRDEMNDNITEVRRLVGEWPDRI